MLCALARAKHTPFPCGIGATGRASPPLLFGLAPRGVCRAIPITRNAVSFYLTFSPLPARTSRTCHPNETGQRFCLWPATEGTCPRNFPHRRFIFCGTFRDRSVPRSAPWRYQARCSSAFRLCGLPLGVRTFLPRFSAPAIAQPTRRIHFTLIFYFVDIQTTLLLSTFQTVSCFVSQVNSPCPHNGPQDMPE